MGIDNEMTMGLELTSLTMTYQIKFKRERIE